MFGSDHKSEHCDGWIIKSEIHLQGRKLCSSGLCLWQNFGIVTFKCFSPVTPLAAWLASFLSFLFLIDISINKCNNAMMSIWWWRGRFIFVTANARGPTRLWWSGMQTKSGTDLDNYWQWQPQCQMQWQWQCQMRWQMSNVMAMSHVMATWLTIIKWGSQMADRGWF